MRRLVFALSLLLLFTALVKAQGSAAGVGQGGGGGMGGFGGGTGGGAWNWPQTHPEDDPDGGRLYEARTAILTPGDRVEYKIKVEKGETLFAGATSEAFDPALSVEEASGHVLAKNDDRDEGDQAPFLAVRLAEAGTYTLKVQSYKQAAGGKFILKMRTLVASDAPLGASVHDFSDLAQDERRVDLRVQAKKGTVYELRGAPAAGGYNGPPNFVRLIGPNGVERLDFERVGTSDSTPVFEARADGDYYAEYQTYGPVRFASELRIVPVVRTAAEGEVSVDIEPGRLAIVDFPVKPQWVVRTTLTGGLNDYRMNAPSVGPPNEGSSDETFGYDPRWFWFELERGSNQDVVRIFRGEGDARIAIRSKDARAQRVTLRNSRSLPKWTPGETIKGKLGIGEIRLYELESGSSELMRVSADAAAFQPRLDVFRLDGQLANTLLDRTKRRAADDLYFPKAGTFLVRLSCDGYGGSGDFTLRRDTPKPTPYTLGTTGTIAFDGTNFGLYAVELEAGKRYQLTTDGADPRIRTDLLDDEGQFLYGPSVQFEDTRVQYFVPMRSGRHRLWLRGVGGAVHFRLEPHVPPKIGTPSSR